MVVLWFDWRCEFGGDSGRLELLVLIVYFLVLGLRVASGFVFGLLLLLVVVACGLAGLLFDLFAGALVCLVV